MATRIQDVRQGFSSRESHARSGDNEEDPVEFSDSEDEAVLLESGHAILIDSHEGKLPVSPEVCVEHLKLVTLPFRFCKL